MWHMVAQLIAFSGVFLLAPGIQRPSVAQLTAQWPLILALSIVSLVSIAGENSALTVVSLTLHESFKSAVPVLTMTFAFLFEGRYYTRPLIVAVLLLAFCSALVCIASVGNRATTNPTLGILLTATATLAASLRPVVTALLMRVPSSADSPPNALASPLVVAWYEALVTLPAYPILFFGSDEREQVYQHMQTRMGEAIGLIAAGSLMAVFYSYALNELIRVASSLSSTVLGTCKHVTMAMISALLIDHVFTDGQHAAYAAIGLAGFVPATSLYAYLMLTQQGLEPWSWRSIQRSCFDWVLGTRPSDTPLPTVQGDAATKA